MKLCRLAFALAILVSVLAAGLTPPAAVGAAPQEIRIAGQFGLVYAPLLVAEKRHIFERYGFRAVWKDYGSGAAVREALIAGEAEAGFMGIPPFLIGWDKGCPWKACLGFVNIPVGLVAYRSDLKSVKDFRPDDKIAVPSPGSVQHILLAMAAQRSLGSATALDRNLVAMAHPDACAALISKKGLAAHFTTPPYLFQELAQPGFHLVTDDEKAFGHPFSFNIGVATTRFHDERPVAYACFILAIQEATAWLNQNMREAAQLMAGEFGLSPEQTYKYLTWPGMNYTTAPYGLLGFAAFMQKAGYIKRAPAKMSEIAWENLLAFVGDRAGEPSEIEKLQY